MEASKGVKLDNVSKPQLQLLKDVSGAFRPGGTFDKDSFDVLSLCHTCKLCPSKLLCIWLPIDLLPMKADRALSYIQSTALLFPGCRRPHLSHGGQWGWENDPYGRPGRQKDR